MLNVVGEYNGVSGETAGKYVVISQSAGLLREKLGHYSSRE